MNEKVKTIFQGKKIRVSSIAICAVLMLIIGTMTAFAAANAEKNLVKNENGVVSHSGDDGATWQEGAPEGMTQIINEDGSTLSYFGDPPEEGADSLSIRHENGVYSYSSDGGKTWSGDAPEGFTGSADGSTGFRFGSANAESAEKSLVKNENGVFSYSNDDGKTWQEGAPEGMTQIINEDGSMLSYIGGPPEEGAGSLSIRHENGVASYSTDGGKTWSDKAPSGFTENSDGSVGFRFNN